MKEETTVTLVNSQGKVKEYKVLLTFNIRETGKSYIVYTDYSLNDSGSNNVFASSYNPYEENSKLESITDKDELMFISKFISKFKNDISFNN